ncbi:unnamed protein product, partial [Prorocentrum cordatum]
RPNRWARRAVCARPPPREALRAKLLVISRGLTRLAGPGGSLAGTDVGPDIAEFNARIEAVVRSTAGRRDAGALSQLAEVMDSVASLAKDISGHQMQLMQEGEGHQDSLLLGVLMAKKGEPMARQLEVLSAPAFARLRVTQAVLARKDTTTPLFQQVASLLDAHGGGAQEAAASRGAAVARAVGSLRARRSRLEASARHAEVVSPSASPTGTRGRSAQASARTDVCAAGRPLPARAPAAARGKARGARGKPPG